MKQIPSSLRHHSATCGDTATFTPKAVNTSALPHKLLAARLPCFATGKPAPAITKAAAVETLKVLAQLDPVPAVSIKQPCRELMPVARARIPSARPANSSTVSPFCFRAISVAAICASVAAGSSKPSRSCNASARERFSRRIRRGKRVLSGILVTERFFRLDAGLVPPQPRADKSAL